MAIVGASLKAGQYPVSLAPGDTVSFALCSAADAMAALIAQERTLMTIEGRESE